jgi:hypothetical protein
MVQKRRDREAWGDRWCKVDEGARGDRGCRGGGRIDGAEGDRCCMGDAQRRW